MLTCRSQEEFFLSLTLRLTPPKKFLPPTIATDCSTAKFSRKFLILVINAKSLIDCDRLNLKREFLAKIVPIFFFIKKNIENEPSPSSHWGLFLYKI